MRTLRIFISSPGDVAEERDRARQVVESLRRRFAARFQLKPDGTVKLWDVDTGKELADKPDFALTYEGHAVRADSSLEAVQDDSDIGIYRTASFQQPDLLHFIQQGLLEFEDRELVWKKNVPLETLSATTAIHYRDDQLARLANPNLTPGQRAVLRLQLCAKANGWRAGLAVWRQARRGCIRRS